MAFDSLTRAPRNLKEGIDWLIALRGTDAKKNLTAMGDALHDLLADKPIGKMEFLPLKKVKIFSRDFLMKPSLRDQPFVDELLEKFNAPMDKTDLPLKRLSSSMDSDYFNIIKKKRLQPEAMARFLGLVVYGCDKFLKHMKIPDQYESVYSPEATWDASCAQDPEACAVVFVGIAPMLYAGLRSLKDATKAAAKDESNARARKRLADVLRAVGYKDSERRPHMRISYIFEALSDVDQDVLDILCDFSAFWAFY
ncbi:hypothetical protein, conserved [Babesia ovata]|uniref:Uncharacterized protein n=1 Tax=Babesia ovata TaxID=189622 RepID=A0A2H6KDB8_9APIC|nr:uncharacterized protein BOVATA_024420 [Babesia ovata]GBE60949.1 hypothetical protein, conserved [Babesia ovata]